MHACCPSRKTPHPTFDSIAQAIVEFDSIAQAGVVEKICSRFRTCGKQTCYVHMPKCPKRARADRKTAMAVECDAYRALPSANIYI